MCWSWGGFPRRRFKRHERALHVAEHAEPAQRMRVGLGLLDRVVEQPSAVSEQFIAKHYCLVFSHGAASYLAQGASNAEIGTQFRESGITPFPVLFQLSTG